jgi:dipeptidyl aminopeptidase/acylaminoacyl peptidase
MQNYLYRFIAIIAFGCSIMLSHASPDMEKYGALPSTSLVAISPNGKLLAFRKVTSDSDRVYVTSLADKKILHAVDASKIEISNIDFFDNDRLYLIASKIGRADGMIRSFEFSTAFVVDIQKKTLRQLLTPGEIILEGQSGLGDIVGISQDRKYAYMPAFSQVDNHSPEPKLTLYKVGLQSNFIRPILSGERYTKDFFLNKEGKPFVQEYYNEVTNEHIVLSLIDGKWTSIFKETTKIRNRSFVGITSDFQSLVMLTRDESNRRNYYTMNLRSGEISESLHDRSDADVGAVLTNDQRVVLGIRYSGFTPSYKMFDPALDNRLKEISNLFPGNSVTLAHWTPDFQSLVIFVEGSDFVGDYFLFQGTQEPQFLTSSRPAISSEDINPIGKITYTSRDGLKIPTLITIPRLKIEDMKNLPAVLMPHGGPASYDAIEFNYWAQALASQGYLVIQPQFRGSTGFGTAHREAGKGEWGRKMQDDLTDAIKFFVAKDYINPEKVCILGGSYGGYAALAGGAFTPDLYRCIVSINGVSDLNDLRHEDRNKFGYYSEAADYMDIQYSKGDVDKAELSARSPVQHVKNFIAPVLLIHGDKDQRVPISQSEHIAKELRAAGKSVEFIKLNGDTHYLEEPETRTQALLAAIEFVNKHLR